MFIPDYIFECLTDISLEFLKDNNIKCILLDIDQTLTEHGSQDIDKKNQDWLLSLKQNNICVMLFSNNNNKRVEPFAKKLGLPFICMANKPMLTNYYLAQKILKFKRENMAAIGDQIFSDIFGANRFRITSILVKYIGKGSSSSLLKIKRLLEKRYIKNYYKMKDMK